MRTTRHNGVASVIAMLYLVLFATLAIGFYAATNTASQVTANDARIARAFLASESGMDFMRYKLANVYIPPNTPPDEVMDQRANELELALNDPFFRATQAARVSINQVIAEVRKCQSGVVDDTSLELTTASGETRTYNFNPDTRQLMMSIAGITPVTATMDK